MLAFQPFASSLILTTLLLYVSAQQGDSVGLETWSINRDSSSETQAFDLYIQIDGNDGYWTILTSRSEYIKAANGKQLKAKIVFNRPNSNEAIKRPCDNPFYLPMTSGTGNFYISVKPPSKTAVHYVDTSKICLYESHTEAKDEIIVPTGNKHINCCTDTRISMESGAPEVSQLDSNTPAESNQGGNSDSIYNKPTNPYQEANADIDDENFELNLDT